MKEHYFDPEDYREPACPLCDPTDARPRPIPVRRVLEKLDAHLARRDADAALRQLDYWIAEAEANRDEGGKLTLLNERMGLLRKEERHAEAIETARSALDMLAAAAEDPLLAGTTCLNAGTVMSAAGKPEEALPLYLRAEKILLSAGNCEKARLAGLYNNKAVALFRLGRGREAEEAYFAALDLLDAQGDALLDRAVTYTNLADLWAALYGTEEGEEKINGALQNAAALLDRPDCPQNAYAAFVLAKCAPAFDFYGWFAYAAQLRERSEKLYERT